MVGTLLSLCLAHSIPGSSSVLVSSHLLQEASLTTPMCPPPEKLHHGLYLQVPFLPPRDRACPMWLPQGPGWRSTRGRGSAE